MGWRRGKGKRVEDWFSISRSPGSGAWSVISGWFRDIATAGNVEGVERSKEASNAVSKLPSIISKIPTHLLWCHTIEDIFRGDCTRKVLHRMQASTQSQHHLQWIFHNLLKFPDPLSSHGTIYHLMIEAAGYHDLIVPLNSSIFRG